MILSKKSTSKFLIATFMGASLLTGIGATGNITTASASELGNITTASASTFSTVSGMFQVGEDGRVSWTFYSGKDNVDKVLLSVRDVSFSDTGTSILDKHRLDKNLSGINIPSLLANIPIKPTETRKELIIGHEYRVWVGVLMKDGTTKNLELGTKNFKYGG